VAALLWGILYFKIINALPCRIRTPRSLTSIQYCSTIMRSCDSYSNCHWSCGFLGCMNMGHNNLVSIPFYKSLNTRIQSFLHWLRLATPMLPMRFSIEPDISRATIALVLKTRLRADSLVFHFQSVNNALSSQNCYVWSFNIVNNLLLHTMFNRIVTK
jgi:hypothetical protein